MVTQSSGLTEDGLNFFHVRVHLKIIYYIATSGNLSWLYGGGMVQYLKIKMVALQK